MSISKTTRIITILVILFSLLLLSCASDGSDATETAIANGPAWLYAPPLSEDNIYGIGSAGDEMTAKQNALVDAARQFSTQVKSMVVLHDQEYMGQKSSVMETFDEQITNHTLTGAKFVEKYTDDNNQIWILAEAPLDCLLDGTESIFITHFLAAEEMKEEGLPQTFPSMEEMRRSIRSAFSEKIETVLNQETMTEAIQSQGYVEPGYLVLYADSKDISFSALPRDTNLYKTGDYLVIESARQTVTRKWNGYLITGWNTKADGSGTYYNTNSLAQIGEEDLVLYPHLEHRDSEKYKHYLRKQITPDERTITVDGKMDDWFAVGSVLTDPLNDTKHPDYSHVDLQGIHLAMDEDYLYVMARTVLMPFPQKGVYNVLKLHNGSEGITIDFAVFRDGPSSKQASAWDENTDQGTDLESISRRMKAAQDEVVEMAIPLKELKDSGFFVQDMNIWYDIFEKGTDKYADNFSNGQHYLHIPGME